MMNNKHLSSYMSSIRYFLRLFCRFVDWKYLRANLNKCAATPLYNLIFQKLSDRIRVSLTEIYLPTMILILQQKSYIRTKQLFRKCTVRRRSWKKAIVVNRTIYGFSQTSVYKTTYLYYVLSSVILCFSGMLLQFLTLYLSYILTAQDRTGYFIYPGSLENELSFRANLPQFLIKTFVDFFVTDKLLHWAWFTLKPAK